jgi:hypothetical protein
MARALAYDPLVPASDVKVAHWLYIRYIGVAGAEILDRTENAQVALDRAAELAEALITEGMGRLNLPLSKQLKDLTQGERAYVDATLQVLPLVVARHNMASEDATDAIAEVVQKVLNQAQTLYDRLVQDG